MLPPLNSNNEVGITLNQRDRRLSGPVGESLGLGVDSQARPDARHRIRNFGRVARVIKASRERPPPKACARSRELLSGRRASWRGPDLVIYLLLHCTIGGELESR